MEAKNAKLIETETRIPWSTRQQQKGTQPYTITEITISGDSLDESPENRSVAARVREGGVGLAVEGQLWILIVIVVTQTYTCDKVAHIYTHTHINEHT